MPNGKRQKKSIMWKSTEQRDRKSRLGNCQYGQGPIMQGVPGHEDEEVN